MLLIAPDSFKGTFSAAQVAAAIGRGVPAGTAAPDLCPLADGGEGTLEVVLAACGGSTEDVPAHDPLGRPLRASIGWLDDATGAIPGSTARWPVGMRGVPAVRGPVALVETARASGLGLVAPGERDAEAASTYGTGELIAAAAARGAGEIVVTVGGSATSDGGAGALEAIEERGGLRGARLTVACDVTTPFERAAEVYGPQKGADAACVARLTARLHALAERWLRDPRGVPMTGAAGGLAGGLWAAHGAALVPGADWVLDAVAFDARLARASAVVTGEGRLDRQTFEGKLVGAVAARCARARVPLHAVVGSLGVDEREARALGLASLRVASDKAALTAAGAALIDSIEAASV